MANLDLADLREQNVRRAQRWHPGFPGDSEWSGGDWGNAMAGEAGEACNVVKKLRRVELSLRGRATEQDTAALCGALGRELADVLIYADLLAAKYGIDLAAYTRDKFNETSIEYGFDERLAGGS